MAVKEIKDILHNLEEFRQTANDEIFQMFESIIAKEIVFHKEFNKVTHAEIDQERINDFILENEKNYVEIKAVAFKIYHKYLNIDLATLLNVVRELRDSRKLLLVSYQQYSATLLNN